MTHGLPSRLASRGRRAAVALALLALALVPVLHHHEFGVVDYPGIHAEARENAPHPAGGPCLACLAYHQKAQVPQDVTCVLPPPGDHGAPVRATIDAPRAVTGPSRPSRAPPVGSVVA